MLHNFTPIMYKISMKVAKKRGNTFTLTIAFVSQVDFQNACKMMSRFSGVAGTQGSKNQNNNTANSSHFSKKLPELQY